MQLAVTWFPPPHREISVALTAKGLGAKEVSHLRTATSRLRRPSSLQRTLEAVVGIDVARRFYTATVESGSSVDSTPGASASATASAAALAVAKFDQKLASSRRRARVNYVARRTESQLPVHEDDSALTL